MERFDIPVDRRGTGSIKWDRAKGKFSTDKELIPLWIADTDFKAPPEAMEAVAGRAEHGVYGYSFAGRDYISSVAGWFNREYGLGVEESWVCPTYGVVTALYFTILALTEPGDRVMIHTPIYDPFYAIIRNTGREIVDCGLVHEDGTYRIDYERMEEQMKAGVRLPQSHRPRVAAGGASAGGGAVQPLRRVPGVRRDPLRPGAVWQSLHLHAGL